MTQIDAVRLADDPMFAVTEGYPEYVAFSPDAYEAAHTTYQVYDEGVLDEIPQALDAYLDQQREICA